MFSIPARSHRQVMLNNSFTKVYSKDLRSCSFSCATALSEGGDESPECPLAVVITTDRHTAKLSPRSKPSRLLLLGRRNEKNGDRVLREGVNIVSSKKTKIEKSRKRKLQDAMKKIQQRDEMPDSENQKHCKSKYRRLRSHPDCKLVLVKTTARVSQV